MNLAEPTPGSGSSVPAEPNLGSLAGLPVDGARPVFAAPWQAQAFALALKLHEAACFTWSEWTESLARAIRSAQERGDPDLGDTYYEHWLDCLETILAEKGVLTSALLAERRQALLREYEDDHGHDHDHDHEHDRKGHAGALSEAEALLALHLKDPASAWSIGIPGAIGEFRYDPDEPAVFGLHHGRRTVVTGRGAIAIELPAAARCLAYEALDGHSRRGWSQGVAFCLPQAAARLPVHRVVTELGPDRGAVTMDKRKDVLFDLGLGSSYLQFCVRSGDPELLAALRAAAGLPLFAPSSAALQAILQVSPHRVLRSQLGRIEVYQAIPPAQGGHVSPAGPHTHLLPELLGTDDRPQAPPVAGGWVPVLTVHPPHPLHDQQGRRRPFGRAAHDAFQELLKHHGGADHLAEKARIARAVLAGERPDSLRLSATALVCRIALRQLPYLHGSPAGLDAWSAAFDPD